MIPGLSIFGSPDGSNQILPLSEAIGCCKRALNCLRWGVPQLRVSLATERLVAAKGHLTLLSDEAFYSQLSVADRQKITSASQLVCAILTAMRATPKATQVGHFDGEIQKAIETLQAVSATKVSPASPRRAVH